MAESTHPNQEVESSAVEPREPETEKGRLAREQYLSAARAVLGDAKLSYANLFERYLGNASETQQAAQSLDQAIARAALMASNTPRMVIQLLAQGPFTQRQTYNLSPEEKQAALPKLLQYAQATVEGVQQQRFVDYANVVTGKVWNYPDLYRAHIGSDLAAIQLDQKVAAAALQAGESAESVAALLQQGPYGRFQRDVKQVKSGMIEQYARGTVAQVQEIQALRPVGVEKLQKRSQDMER
ncbi:MAG: hypothetical protein MJA27_25720 [Pseudanabaenales cyanobacterium]|nr:hypothetical protein [Pseudanabaenales cyanobacterium]